MNEKNTPDTTTTERRRAPASSIWADMLAETVWRPSDKPRESDSWLRAHGYLPDRRAGR